MSRYLPVGYTGTRSYTRVPSSYSTRSYPGYGSLYGSRMYDYTHYPFSYGYDMPSVAQFGYRPDYSREKSSLSDLVYWTPEGYRYRDPGTDGYRHRHQYQYWYPDMRPYHDTVPSYHPRYSRYYY